MNKLKMYFVLIFFLLSVFCAKAYSQDQPLIVTVGGLSIEKVPANFVNLIMNKFGKNADQIVDSIKACTYDSNISYLGEAIETMGFNDIYNFDWGRDPSLSQGCEMDLENFLNDKYNLAQSKNKKFVIVAHSWGTVLSYTALTRINIKVDLFITLGSPLGSMNAYSHWIPALGRILTSGNTNLTFPDGTYVVPYYTNLHLNEAGINKISKLPGISRWVNFWDWGDIFSGPLNNADSDIEDIRMDKSLRIMASFNRNYLTTITWHKYNSLEVNPFVDNSDIRLRVKQLINDLQPQMNNSCTIGLILDSSGSMTTNDPRDSRKAAAKMILDNLNNNENVFIIDFDERASFLNTESQNSTNKQYLKSKIESINSAGSTNIGAGLSVLTSALESKNVNYANVAVLLLSDGLGSYTNEADWYSQRNIPVYTISFIGEDNSVLLSKIANETGGSYFKAKNEIEIYRAFTEFVGQIQCLGKSKIFSILDKIFQGDTKYFSFICENGTSEFTAMNSYWGSKIGMTLISPNGKMINENSGNTDWIVGNNYSSVKIANPQPGVWKAKLDGIQIPQEGEPFTFEVLSDAPNIVRINTVSDDKRSCFKIIDQNKTLDIGSFGISASVLQPNGITANLNSGIKNLVLDFEPRGGKGDYIFNFHIRVKDKSGNDLERFLTRTVYFGDAKPSNISFVTEIQGSFVLSDLGLFSGNREGVLVNIYSHSGEKKASGYITAVSSSECTAEIQMIYSSSELLVGDIFELDPQSWSRD